MSVNSERICCTGCDFETWDLRRPIRVVYRMKGGKEVELWRAKGWCYECNNYEDIEDIDPETFRIELVEDERERRKICSRADKLSKVFLADIRNKAERRKLHDSIERLDKEIRDRSDLLEIVTNRKAGPRCLSCWSDKTAPVIFDGSDNLSHNFLHSCGGMLKLIVVDFLEDESPRFNFALTTYVLNEEGELLEMLKTR